MWAKILLVSLASCAHGSPVELLNGRLISHHAVPSLTQVRLVPATAAPIAVRTNPRDEEGYDPHPQYNFGYSIADTLTGDSKTREESRDGDVVTGSYSVADPDGRIRTVTYTADAIHGFQAKVTYDGAEGPVAIPFNAPAPATAAVAAVAPIAVTTTDEENTIIAARAPTATTSSLDNIITRQSAATQFIPLRTIAAAPTAVHAVHAQPQFIRQFNGFSPAVHTVQRVASPQAIHTVQRVAAPQAVHAVHAVHHATPVVTAVRQTVPEAVHAVHTVHNHNAGPFTVIRQNNGPQSLDSIFANSGLDLSQFRFVSPVSFIN